MRYTISFLLTSLLATPVLAEVPRVVTDIHPVHSLVAQVMGSLGTPGLLLEKGADEHAFQLKPSQAAEISEADLVVWIGPELTPWLDRALDSTSGDVARLGLLAAEGTFLQDFASGGDHDHEADSAEHDEHDHEAAEPAEHDHEAEGHDDHGAQDGVDPHVWLDPANAENWLRLIAAELGRIDPDNATTYAANADAAASRITAMDGQIAAMLAPAQGKPFVVFHDAYGYFVGHYGLNVAGSVALGDAASPGAARLAALRDTVAAGGSLCIFPEVQHDPALVLQMAEGSDARIGGAIDPSGSSLPPGPDLYQALMTGLAATLAACIAG